jgi:hypothetical protein
MNNAPFFDIVKNNAGVQAIFGTNPVRIYPFEYAQTKGDQLTKPYATFQLSGGRPENNLSDRPKSDYVDLQIDIYGTKVKETKDAADAIETAVELDCYIVRLLSGSIENETKLYRSTFLTSWFVGR